MANKLYIFGIGGTGSRVIKALTMLMAAGVKVNKKFETVIPIIIDPDISNGDLNRTKDILRLYQEIRNEIYQPINFFGQDIKTINEIAGKEKQSSISPDYFHFKLKDVENSKFKDFIGYDSLSSNFIEERDDKSFIDLLYSDKNLEANLDVGFKGHPNMGAIVLDQFTSSENFQKFANTFSDGDAIFIINSIFGGTGAAGYPLLLKNLRGNEDILRHEKIKDAYIGALTMLPYFALKEQDEVDAESFEHKAIAALKYYERTIFKKNAIDFQYLIGNQGNDNLEEYSVGGETQKNKAHFFELAGALAILDFSNKATDEREEYKTEKYRFGVQDYNNSIIDFKNLDKDNNKQMAKELTKFKLFSTYLNKRLPETLGKARWTKRGFVQLLRKKELNYSILDELYFDSNDYKNQIKRFLDYFDEWMDEMGDDKRKPSFAPFRSIKNDNALSIIKGSNIDKGFDVVDVINNKNINDKDIRDHGENKRHSTLIKLFDTSLEITLADNEVLKTIIN